MSEFFSGSREKTQIQDDKINYTPTRVYNPYQNMEDPSKLQPFRVLYELPTSPEFLFEEEALKRRRSMSENLTYGTGWAYLTGALGGGIYGTVSALKAVETGESLKLVINRVLNSGGSGGRKFGNRLGVMGLMFSVLESSLYNLRGEDDALNYVAAGLATGAIFKAAAGPRSAAVAGGLGAVLGGAAVVGKKVVKRYAPI
ncbi:OLC1v1000882C1 [Oldenlandia corymbosa var. corymbosa]|uniref:OLC1v1000882C1 n=1 Tax=Oldenlandia corymbosa var. corymbosa TaxID=529605 RepID=A0AAV1D5K6_OLDCO|nr:OLC1v1000882C1 [Oldenlandia corymbosa var. corymbosa]